MLKWNDRIIAIEECLFDAKYLNEGDEDYDVFRQVMGELKRAVSIISTITTDMRENYPEQAKMYDDEFARE